MPRFGFGAIIVLSILLISLVMLTRHKSTPINNSSNPEVIALLKNILSPNDPNSVQLLSTSTQSSNMPMRAIVIAPNGLIERVIV